MFPAMSARTYGLVLLTFAFVGVVVTWVILGVFSAVIREPIQATAEFIGRQFGTAGLVGAFVLLVGGAWYGERRSLRKHEAKQFALDRTIYVEKPHPRRGLARAVIACYVLFFGFIFASMAYFGFR